MDHILKDLGITPNFGDKIEFLTQQFMKIIQSKGDTHQMREQIEKNTGLTNYQVLAIQDRVKEELKKGGLSIIPRGLSENFSLNYQKANLQNPFPQNQYTGAPNNKRRQMLLQQPPSSGKFQVPVQNQNYFSRVKSAVTQQEEVKINSLMSSLETKNHNNFKIQQPLQSPSKVNSFFRETTADSPGSLASEDPTQLIPAQFITPSIQLPQKSLYPKTALPIPFIEQGPPPSFDIDQSQTNALLNQSVVEISDQNQIICQDQKDNNTQQIQESIDEIQVLQNDIASSQYDQQFQRDKLIIIDTSKANDILDQIHNHISQSDQEENHGIDDYIDNKLDDTESEIDATYDNALAQKGSFMKANNAPVHIIYEPTIEKDEQTQDNFIQASQMISNEELSIQNIEISQNNQPLVEQSQTQLIQQQAQLKQFCEIGIQYEPPEITNQPIGIQTERKVKNKKLQVSLEKIARSLGFEISPQINHSPENPGLVSPSLTSPIRIIPPIAHSLNGSTDAIRSPASNVLFVPGFKPSPPQITSQPMHQCQDSNNSFTQTQSQIQIIERTAIQDRNPPNKMPEAGQRVIKSILKKRCHAQIRNRRVTFDQEVIAHYEAKLLLQKQQQRKDEVNQFAQRKRDAKMVEKRGDTQWQGERISELVRPRARMSRDDNEIEEQNDNENDEEYDEEVEEEGEEEMEEEEEDQEEEDTPNTKKNKCHKLRHQWSKGMQSWWNDFKGQ